MHVNEIGRRNLTKRTFPCYQSDMATPKPAQTTTDRAQDSIAAHCLWLSLVEEGDAGAMRILFNFYYRRAVRDFGGKSLSKGLR